MKKLNNEENFKRVQDLPENAKEELEEFLKILMDSIYPKLFGVHKNLLVNGMMQLLLNVTLNLTSGVNEKYIDMLEIYIGILKRTIEEIKKETE